MGMIKCSNGYFQFSSREDGLYLTVYPPKEGENPANIADALYYIDKRKISDCDMVQVNEVFKKALKEPCTVKVSSTPAFPVREFGDYRISSDFMTVEAVFYPPFEGAEELDEEEICKDILMHGVRYGIDRNVIKSFLTEKKYGEPYVVALGKEPRKAEDGYIEYKFDPNIKPTPKVNDDGTVDFRSLDNMNHVKKGDVVAILHPEDKGDDGLDVLNRPVHPQRVKHVIFRFGRNLVVSDDGLSLISQVSGHVTLENDKVFVSNSLELVDVDTSTGNIEYEGNVIIKGNVLSGFTVKASGDVSVSGIVEGATIIAGGSITFNCGVQGMTRAVIQAGRNIVTKFIESAQLVEAGGTIETDSILHSRVFAKGAITAAGKNGLIVGGDVRSAILVSVKTIGNEMGTATIVGAGIDPSVGKRVRELKTSLEQIGKNKIQLNQMVTALRKKQELDGGLSPEKQELQNKTVRSLVVLDQELAAQKKEYEEIQRQMSENINARIKVSNAIYNGVKLVFGEQYLFIKEKYSYCQFAKQGADIVRLSL